MTATEPHTQIEQTNRSPWPRRRQPAEWTGSPADVLSSRNETVLIVDAEPMVRELMAEILRSFGYRVLEASDALQAQRLLGADEKINLLLTDFSMPETNGLALARWLQGKRPELKVLITTGSMWDLANQIGDQERVAVLPKPFDDVQLGRMVRLILGGSSP